MVHLAAKGASHPPRRRQEPTPGADRTGCQGPRSRRCARPGLPISGSSRGCCDCYETHRLTQEILASSVSTERGNHTAICLPDAVLAITRGAVQYRTMSTDRFDVAIVGAGFGGIGAAIQLRKMGYENILILDREDDLGGTWHVNRYPGLAVDIPSPTYSYWFEPNPSWSRLFAPGDEIKQYADHVADKYDVRRHMRFNTTVDSARWDEDDQVWQVALANGETLTTRFLITATGFLSQPCTPDIPGIEDFAGRIIHTTAWDDSYDFDGRRVGLIGTGATAVQLIPELAKKAADLTVYQRTPIHVVPKIDFPIPKFLRRLFARVPLIQRAFRWTTDA